jgi:hypothetical protein
MDEVIADIIKNPETLEVLRARLAFLHSRGGRWQVAGGRWQVAG